MTAGGRREGSGRPKNSGKYGEPTTSIRVPTRLLEDVRRYVLQNVSPVSGASSHAQAKP